MQEIAYWLKTLGLSEYAARFAENRIDFSVLRDLTYEDLKDLGVVLGDRRKMLRAIAKSWQRRSGSTRTRPSNTRQRRAPPGNGDVLRPGRFDGALGPDGPGGFARGLSAYQKCVAETVRRFGGFVAKYMGDGVLVYFGYPQAHEDDAERAVRAGLALVEAVASSRRALRCKPVSA